MIAIVIRSIRFAMFVSVVNQAVRGLGGLAWDWYKHAVKKNLR